MKKLCELIDCEYDTPIDRVVVNSKEAGKGALFVCTDMGTSDRHAFIDDAIARGVSAVVVKKDVGEKSVPIIRVDDPNEVMPLICEKLYDHPLSDMTVIGVTGTDGKTSVATMIQTLMGDDVCGYSGTNGYGCRAFHRDTDNNLTTPDANKLYAYFREFADAGMKYISMEVSSDALLRGRVRSIEYDVTVLTNITSEHLNSHKTLENYVECKCRLFSQTKKDGWCILNADSLHFEQAKAAATGKVLTYGKDPSCDMYFKNVKLHVGSSEFTMVYRGREYDIDLPAGGDFNIYNLCAASLVMFVTGHSFEDFSENIAKIDINGRLDIIDVGQDFYAMVDYAHTPNAISNLLRYLKLLDVKRTIIINGQPGERDPYKRRQVPELEVREADYVIFCYEDPRSEDPEEILRQMTENIHDFTNWEIVVDRSEAIKRAVDMAEPNDIIMILGKGNEKYQKFKDRTIYFCDEEEMEKHIVERLEREGKPVKKRKH